MAAVENATDEGTLEAFSSDDDTMPNQTTVTATASVVSRAGRALEQGEKYFKLITSLIFISKWERTLSTFLGGTTTR
jgi:hypothetical protein